MSNNKKWLNEYEVFLKSDQVVVPRAVSEKVWDRLQPLLNPSAGLVFAKVLGIHVVMGFLSLGVCHQFGINPFGTSQSLDTWFMAMWGHSTCMVACGVLFVGLSLLSAGTFLTIEELRALKRTEFIQSFALGAVSLALFAVAGAELVVTFGVLWFVGAWIGGVLATEAVWNFRRRLV